MTFGDWILWAVGIPFGIVVWTFAFLVVMRLIAPLVRKIG